MESEKWVLTVKETAALLGISANLCYDLVKQGQIPALKLGQKRIVIPRASLLKMMDGGNEKPCD